MWMIPDPQPQLQLGEREWWNGYDSDTDAKVCFKDVSNCNDDNDNYITKMVMMIMINITLK